MLRFVVKALITVWPFLKNAIFRDRTVVEVLLENKHLTILFSLLVVLAITLGAVIVAFSQVKDQLVDCQLQLERLHTTLQKTVAQHSQDLLRAKEPRQEDPCVKPSYDKSHLIKELEDS